MAFRDGSDKPDSTINCIAGLSPFLCLVFCRFPPRFLIELKVLTVPIPFIGWNFLSVISLGVGILTFTGGLVASLLFGYHRSEKVAFAARAFLIGWGAGLLVFLASSMR